MNFKVRVLAAAGVWTWLLATSSAAGETTKQDCVAAAGRGQVLRDEGKLVAAHDALAACAVEECPAIVRDSCTRWQSEVRARLPTLRVEVSDAAGNPVRNARITVDGGPRPTIAEVDNVVDPGFHAIEVAVSGSRVSETVTVEEGARRVVMVRLPPAPLATEPEPERAPMTETRPSSAGPIPAPTWIFGGVAVASFGAFAILGVTAERDLDLMKRTCAPYCPVDERDEVWRRALVADVALAIGIASTIGAVVTFIGSRTAPQRSASSSARVSIRP